MHLRCTAFARVRQESFSCSLQRCSSCCAFVLYAHAIRRKLDIQSWETWGFRTFVSRFILAEVRSILMFLFYSPRVVLFPSVWLWAPSASSQPGVWRNTGGWLAPEPRLQPAERSKFWITVGNDVLGWCSACSSRLRLGDQQYPAFGVRTASNPAARVWLWYLQRW